MKENKVIHPIRFIGYLFLGLSFLYLFLLIYNFAKNNVVNGVIFSCIYLLHILSACIFWNFKIIILDDCFKYTFFFRTKTYKFEDYIIEEDVSCIRVFDENGSEKKRISYFYDTNNQIYRQYAKYCNEHQIEKNIVSTSAKYNFYVRNLAISWLILGFIICIGAGVAGYQQIHHIIDELPMVVTLSSMGILFFLYGLIELIKYVNFRITIYEDYVEYVNLFRYRRKIDFQDIALDFTTYRVKIRIKKRLPISKFYYCLDNIDTISKCIEKKK